MPDAIDSLLRLTLTDLSRSLAALEYIGATLASAHLSAALDALHHEYGIEHQPMRVILLPEYDFTMFDFQLDTQFGKHNKD